MKKKKKSTTCQDNTPFELPAKIDACKQDSSSMASEAGMEEVSVLYVTSQRAHFSFCKRWSNQTKQRTDFPIAWEVVDRLEIQMTIDKQY